MAHEHAVESPALPETPTSAMPAPVPEVAEAIEKAIDAVEPRPWRGIYLVEMPAQAIFTKQIDIRSEQLEEWQPRGVTSTRQVRNDND